MGLSTAKLASGFMSAAIAVMPVYAQNNAAAKGAAAKPAQSAANVSVNPKIDPSSMIVKSDNGNRDAGLYARNTHHIGFVLHVSPNDPSGTVNKVALAYLKVAQAQGVDEAKVFLQDMPADFPHTTASAYIGDSAYKSSGAYDFAPIPLMELIPDIVRKARAVQISSLPSSDKKE